MYALSAGVVLTGGGSLVKNICPLANESLGMDAKIGLPLGITGGLVEEVNSPIYATAVGLVIHALKTGMNNQKTMIPASSKATSVEQVMNKIADRMKGWFKEL